MLSKDAANAFRSIAHARHSCKRFQRDKPIPGYVLKDIVNTSLVRTQQDTAENKQEQNFNNRHNTYISD